MLQTGTTQSHRPLFPVRSPSLFVLAVVAAIIILSTLASVATILLHRCDPDCVHEELDSSLVIVQSANSKPQSPKPNTIKPYTPKPPAQNPKPSTPKPYTREPKSNLLALRSAKSSIQAEREQFSMGVDMVLKVYVQFHVVASIVYRLPHRFKNVYLQYLS